MLADAGQPIQFRIACDETPVVVLMLADWEYRRTVLNVGRVSLTESFPNSSRAGRSTHAQALRDEEYNPRVRTPWRVFYDVL